MKFISPYVLINLCVLRIAISDVSHLTHHGFFRHQYQTLYNTPSQIKPVEGPPTTISTTTEFLLPEIIINKRAKNQNGYDYNRPIKPPSNTYIPISSDDQFQPIEIPIQQFPNEEEKPEFSNESILPPSIEAEDNTPPPISQGYLPAVKQDIVSTKNLGSDNIIVTYDRNVFEGYDYNVPTNKPFPIFIPTPAVGADVPIIEPNPFPTNPSDIPVQGYNYEIPVSSSDNFPSTPASEPQNGYLPPIPSAISLRHSKDFSQLNVNVRNPIKLHLKEMRCLNNQAGYFKALLRIDSFIGLIPIIDNDIIDSRCDLRLIQSHVVVNIAAEDFVRCGIRTCGENLCIRIRFPLIRGMKTGTDSLLTLQCKIQEKIVAKTHSLKMGITNKIQGRALEAVAHGGNQQPFRTQVQLLRKSSNGFTKHLEPHGLVQLGEELLLRAHVNPGDGWNYTKLTDINLQKISSSGEIINSANLITTAGCVNPIMQSICPVKPSFDPPLGHRMSFKAIMFQGMQSGDEIIMNMKVTGCIERADCYINTQYCNNSLGRLKRSLDKNKSKNNNSSEFEEISTISFRVIVANDSESKHYGKFQERNYLNNDNLQLGQLLYLIGGSVGILCFIIFLVIIIYLKLKR